MTDTDSLKENFLPIVYKIDEPGDDIFKYDEKPIISKSIVYPAFSLGFQHFIHQTRNTKIEITDKFEGKKKVYNIVNSFERDVDDYESDINSISKTYFDIDPKPNIIDRRFYDMWELMFMFNLVDLDAKNITSVHLSDGNGSFIQAVLLYRDKFSKHSKNDNYYNVSLDNNEIDLINDEFMNYYKKEKPQRVTSGNLNSLKKKADLITANGNFKWDNMNIQEMDAYKILLNQILNALKLQSKKGNFVLKIYESYTYPTIKLIAMLKSFYDNVYVAKPLMSRLSDDDKYIVCLGFKENDSKIKKIENIVNSLKNNMNIIDFFPKYELDDNFKVKAITFNREISIKQFVTNNKIIDFLNKQNFRGDDYVSYRNEQIEASKYWLNLYYPDTKDFFVSKKEVEKLVKFVNDKNNESVTKLKKRLD